MSARIETAEKSMAVKNKEAEKIKIVGFDAERFRAPFTLRCAALLVDYLLLVIVPVLALMMGRNAGLNGAKLLDNATGNMSWLLILLIVITNFIVLPVVVGRTVGKAAVGLRIAQKDGSNLTIVSALLRHLVGYPLTILTAGIGFLVAIFDSKGRSLHDFLAGTIVVLASSRRIIQSETKSVSQS